MIVAGMQNAEGCDLSTEAKEKIGFIGIGLMGRPMVLRLLSSGYEVRVWNRSREKLSAVVAEGAAPVDTVAELVEQSDLILLCLADTDVVEQLVFSSGGVIESARPGQLLIDLSSIEPDATCKFAAELEMQTGMRWVDAPVSGGVIGAETGRLAIMAGGRAEDIQRVRSVLAAFSQRLTHMGENGAGQISKVCNQMIVSCNALVIAEVMALARSAGIDAERLPEALQGGFADSIPLQLLGPQMATDTFEPVKWHVRTLLKDLDTATLLSRNIGSATPMSGLAAQLMRQHAGQGNAARDPATLVQMYLAEKE